jgi:hypothetical protein
MMRFTVIDDSGTVSFAGPGHCLKALTAACSTGASTLPALLERVQSYDAMFVDSVRRSLAQFDEHVVESDLASIVTWLDRDPDTGHAVFRVFNQRLRNMSLMPEPLGVVLFNLRDRRIVQIQNTYGQLLRKDRGRIRVAGKPVNRYYHYALPDSWELLP